MQDYPAAPEQQEQ